MVFIPSDYRPVKGAPFVSGIGRALFAPFAGG
jgi:hypothetical protein